jgi:hypothetical protein
LKPFDPSMRTPGTEVKLTQPAWTEYRAVPDSGARRQKVSVPRAKTIVVAVATSSPVSGKEPGDREAPGAHGCGRPSPLCARWVSHTGRVTVGATEYSCRAMCPAAANLLPGSLLTNVPIRYLEIRTRVLGRCHPRHRPASMHYPNCNPGGNLVGHGRKADRLHRIGVIWQPFAFGVAAVRAPGSCRPAW